MRLTVYIVGQLVGVAMTCAKLACYINKCAEILRDIEPGETCVRAWAFADSIT